jgi:MFS family permease
MTSLLTALVVQFGPHFAKNVAPLKVYFSADPGWNITSYEWGLFQTAVTLPIAVFPWFVGRRIDTKAPLKDMVVWALIMTCIGEYIFIVACKDKLFPMALFGRFCFGIGEGLTSALSGYIAVFFAPKHRLFAIGLVQSFHAMAVGLSKAILAPIAEVSRSYVTSLYSGLCFCFISLIGVSLWKPRGIRDRRPAEDTCDSPRSQQLKICCQGPPGRLSIDFWTVALIHMLISSSHRLFGHIDAAFLALKFRRSPESAGYLSAITEVVSIAVCPLMGYLLDRHGSVMTLPRMLVFATVSGSIGYAILAFASRGFALETGLWLIGIVNALTPTVMKSVVPETLHDSVLATGLGVYESSESFGVLAGSSLIGLIAARSGDDYSACVPIFSYMLVFAGMLSLSLVIRRTRTQRSIVSTYIDDTNAKVGNFE